MTISTTTIFSAMQHYNIAATLFRMVATLFQHSNTVLRVARKIVLTNRLVYSITLTKSKGLRDFSQ